ncbi:hypothetical protein [Paraburkholderia sp. CI3]
MTKGAGFKASGDVNEIRPGSPTRFEYFPADSTWDVAATQLCEPGAPQ